MARKVPINFLLLDKAIAQAGPWKDQDISVTLEWFLQELKFKIYGMDWGDAKKDVERFLRPRELSALDVWSKDFFLS